MWSTPASLFSCATTAPRGILLRRGREGVARLERLTYVHDGIQGPIGAMIVEARGSVRFGADGSGLIEIGESSAPGGMRGVATQEVAVRIVAMLRSQLPPAGASAVQDDVPCIIGHSGDEVAVLVPARSLARVSGGMSDLRGKIKFGLARVGWDITNDPDR